MNNLSGKQATLLLKLWLACCLSVVALQAQAQQVTTFILVRHAEKAQDGSKDPSLSEEGNARAKRLDDLLNRTNIDAIYTTAYKRTRSTVEPIAQTKGVSILEYEPQRESAIDAMLKDHAGKTILVTGHSNTIPEIANWLTGTKQFKDFEDTDYGNVIIVSLVSKGTGAKVTWLRY